MFGEILIKLLRILDRCVEKSLEQAVDLVAA